VPLTFHWFLPTNGDSRSIVGASHASSHHTVPANYREPSRRYLAEVARAADRLGFEGVLTPTGTWCEDAWLTAAALLSETERLKFLVASGPGWCRRRWPRSRPLPCNGSPKARSC
jgi:alkanesulfonate monooxygenase